MSVYHFTIFNLLLLSFSLYAYSEKINSKNIFLVKLSSEYQHFNFFAHDAVGGKVLFSYTSAKNYALRASFRTLNKFDTMAYQGSIGASYWVTDNTVLSCDAEIAPKAIVVPIQSYFAEISQSIGGILTPSFLYRFSNYKRANMNIVSPALSWKISDKFELKGRYTLTLSQFMPQSGRIPKPSINNSSGDVSIFYKPASWIQPSLGYSLGSEAFDSGDPITGLSSFSYQSIFGGIKFLFDQHLGIELTADQQFRNNGFLVTSAEVGLFYTW